MKAGRSDRLNHGISNADVGIVQHIYHLCFHGFVGPKAVKTAFLSSIVSKRRNAGILPSLEDLLFYTVAEGQEKIPAHKFLTALKATGLRTGDPRLKECMETLKETLKKTSDGVTLDRHLFK
ncbi:glutaminase kidney isoform, mitochondrial-like isoform X1, partial [Lates japonicus]